MKRLTVFAFQKDSEKIVRRLMSLRCVEISRLDLSDSELELRRISKEQELAESERRIAAIKEVLPTLSRYSDRRAGLGRTVHEFDPNQFERDGSRERAERTVEQARALSERINEVRAEKTRLETDITALTPWLECDLSLSDVETQKTQTVLGFCVEHEALTEALEQANGETEPVGLDSPDTSNVCLNDSHTLLVGRDGGYLTVTYLKENEQAMLSLLARYGFVKSELPVEAGTPQQVCDRRAARLSELETELLSLEEQMKDLAEHVDDVEILYDLEETSRSVAKLHQRLAQTDTCTVLDGWIPEIVQDAVEEKLKKFECAYEIDDPAPEDEPPVLLQNNKFAMNFEWVVGMYSYPKYGRFDPTFIMSLFYFLSFGLMFADVGYGLILTLACFGGIRLLNPKPGLRRMMYMFGYCGISAIVMGLLFGGWFGDFPTAIMQNLLGLSIDTSVGHFFGSGLWFNPLDNPMVFLILSLGFGFLHIVAGMAIQFYVLCKDGKPWEAICTILPYWVIFAGVLLMLLVGVSVGLTVFIVGAVMVLLLNGYGIKNPFSRLMKGLGGLYGLVNYMSDLLSYSRILALSLVAAVLAKVINMITMMGKSGAVGVIVMVLVLLVGHTFNLAINVLGAFVHTSRLQYLEFFGKFYEDGGRAFEPAEPSQEYSEPTEF